MVLIIKIRGSRMNTQVNYLKAYLIYAIQEKWTTLTIYSRIASFILRRIRTKLKIIKGVLKCHNQDHIECIHIFVNTLSRK